MKEIVMKLSKFKILIFSVVTFVTFLILLELSYRAVVILVKGSESDYDRVMEDKNFGWVHNILEKERIIQNKCGEDVARKPSTHPLFTHIPTYIRDKKILFIGDSFTHAWHVSTGRRYYDIFEDSAKNDYSVYAAGVGGYGSTQEYMLLETIYDQVRPDIVVWQLCGNDVANNIFELGDNSPLTKRRPRPYWDLETDKIEIRDAGISLFDISQFLRFIYARSLVLDKKFELGIRRFFDTSEKISSDDQKKYEQQGLRVLERALSQAIKNFPATKFYGFAVDNKFEDDYAATFRKNNAVYFDRFHEHIDSVENTNCKPLDKHWNHLGHRIAGELLYMLIMEQEKLKNDESRKLH